MNQWHSLALVIFVGAINVIVSIVLGGSVSIDLLKNASLVSAALGALLFVFDRLLWRLPFLHPWFVAAPNLNGPWDVTGDIAFLPNDANGSYEGRATVSQRFFSISITIDWGHKGTTKFLARSPIVFTSDGLGGFPALFQWTPEGEDEHEAAAHLSGFFCHTNVRLPESLDLRYSTEDRQIGLLTLTRQV